MKICKCGNQGLVTNSRIEAHRTMRRYKCFKCNETWTTFEELAWYGIKAHNKRNRHPKKYNFTTIQGGNHD